MYISEQIITPFDCVLLSPSREKKLCVIVSLQKEFPRIFSFALSLEEGEKRLGKVNIPWRLVNSI